MTTEVHLPELGENIEEAEVLKVLVSEGDEVQAGQEVVQLETDKAAVGLPSPAAGRVAHIAVKEGDRIQVGATVLTLETTERGEAAPVRAEPPPAEERGKPEPPRAEAPPPRIEEPPHAEPPPRPTEERRGAVSATAPSVRKLARELGVDLNQVPGTASHGRITPEDVKAYVRRLVAGTWKSARELPRMPDFREWGEIERRPMNGIRRRTASVVDLSWQMIPHVTHFDSADVTELEEARRRHERERKDGSKEKITLTALLLKACGTALTEFEAMNSSLDAEAEELVLKRYAHIGVAVDTKHGLLVPVVRDADRKSVNDIASEMNDLAARARERRLRTSELKGASFTITNLGGIGGTAFTPIIHFPQAAILGVASTRNEVVPQNGKSATRLLLPLCLSYDHRIVDGATAARFVRRLATLLADPFELFLRA